MIKYCGKFKQDNKLVFINKDNYFNLMHGPILAKFYG
jgi:hypothetical protein